MVQSHPFLLLPSSCLLDFKATAKGQRRLSFFALLPSDSKASDPASLAACRFQPANAYKQTQVSAEEQSSDKGQQIVAQKRQEQGNAEKEDKKDSRNRKESANQQNEKNTGTEEK